MLLHSINKWPHTLSIHLWPYTLFHCNDIRNHLPLKSNSTKSRFEIFPGSSVQPKLKNFHTFGCPVFTLDSNLQNNKSIPKWNVRCRLGIYLGNSPQRARSVTLVLNLTTARVSPQFHVTHDHFFDTVEQGNKDVQKWNQLAGFNTIKYTIISLRDVTNHLRQRLSPDALIRELEGVMLTVTDHNVTPTSATNLVNNDSPVEPVALRRLSRVRRPTRRLLESKDTM